MLLIRLFLKLISKIETYFFMGKEAFDIIKKMPDIIRKSFLQFHIKDALIISEYLFWFNIKC